MKTTLQPLQGLFQTANYGGGRNDLERQLNEYDGALAVGLYLVDTTCGAELRKFNFAFYCGRSEY